MRISIICLLAFIIVTGAGCAGNPDDKAKQGAQGKGDAGREDAGTFTKIAPQRKTIERLIEQPAHLEAYEETPLVVRIPGYVDKIFVDIGDEVKKGKELAVLRVPEMDIDL